MTQYDLNLRDYWRIIRRRKWIVIVVPLLFSVIAFGMAFLRTPSPVYQATASVRFERSLNVTGVLLKDVIAFSPVGDLETQAALIRSFRVMSRVAKKLGLIPEAATPAEIRASSAMREVVSRLGEQVEVTLIDGTSLIGIKATSPDPVRAAQLANSVAEAFQEDNVATRSQQVVEARRFIEAQLGEVGRRLRESEEMLKVFQETNKIVLLPEEARAALQRLATQEAESAQIKKDIGTTEIQLRRLKERPIEDALPGFSPDGASPALAKLHASLTELIVERENLLLTLRPTHPRVKGVDARIANVRRSLRVALSSRLQVLKARAAEVQKVMARLGTEQAALPAATLEMTRMEREVKINERIFSLLKERLQEALIKEKEQVAEVSIVRPAMVPSEPLNTPQAGAKAAVGLLIGLVISLVLAVVVEALDTSIGAIEEVESLLGTPVLGVIPHLDIKAELAEEHGEAVTVDRGAEDRYSFLVSLFAPRSPVAEAFRGLRTNILFSTLERDAKTLMVASAAQMEGKTTVAINLAISLAQLGKKTLLVESDLRNPFIRHTFGLPKAAGLTEVVLGSASLDEVTLGFDDLMLGKPGMERLLDSPGMDNFFFLPSGYASPNQSELLSSPRLVQVLAEARQRYDCIILDSAPVLSVADSAVLGSRVDGVLSIVRVGRVPRAALRRAKVLLETTKSHMLGVCLTGVRAEVSPDYAEMAYYRYRYGARPTKTEPKRKPGRLIGGRKRFLGRAVLVVLALLALTSGVWAWRSGRRIQPPPSTGGSSQPVQAASVATPPAGNVNLASLPSRPEVFTVQLHAFTSEDRADQIAAEYRRTGLEAFSVEAVVPGKGRWWRVFVGEFVTRVEAEMFGEKLIRKGIGRNFTVRRIPGAKP